MTRSIDRSVLAGSPARQLSLSIIGCLLLADLICLPFSALRFSPSNLVVCMSLVGLYLLAGPMQRRFGFSPVTRYFAVEVYILLLFGAVGFIFSYLTIENGWTIRDDLFVSIDRFLGFDWKRYTSFVLQNDLLRPMSFVLYVLTPPFVGIALFRYCLKGNFDHASELVAMVIVGGVLCVLISGILPSAGGAGYFPADSDFYRGHNVVFDNTYKITLFQLRDGAGMDVFLLHPDALIAFPSYHACLALLVILAFRGTGVTGWTILALNLGALLSLPVQGGHHLSDVLGGLLTGATAFLLVRQTLRTRV